MEQRVKELEENYNAQKDDLYLPLATIKAQHSNLYNIEEEKLQEYNGHSPSKINLNSNQAKSQNGEGQEYASTEELMAMLKFGVDKKFKSFLDS